MKWILFRRFTLTLLLAAYLSACVSTPKKDFTQFRAEDPRSILVLPVVNSTVNIDAPDYFLSTISRPVADRGFYVFPIHLTKRVLEDDGLSDANLVHEADPTRLGEIFGADAILYITINRWDARYVVLNTTVTVGFTYVLKSGYTGETLWTETSVFKYSSGSGSGGLGGLLADAISAAITKGAPNYIPLAQQANVLAVAKPRSGFPAGPYREEYGEDLDNFPILFPDQLASYQASRAEAASPSAPIQSTDLPEKSLPFTPPTDSGTSPLPNLEPSTGLSEDLDEVERLRRIQDRLAVAAGKKTAAEPAPLQAQARGASTPNPKSTRDTDETERMRRIQEKLAGAAGKNTASAKSTSELPQPQASESAAELEPITAPNVENPSEPLMIAEAYGSEKTERVGKKDNLVLGYSVHSDNTHPIEVRVGNGEYLELGKGEIYNASLEPGSYTVSIREPNTTKSQKPDWDRFDVNVDVVDLYDSQITIMVQAPESEIALKLYVLRNAKIVFEQDVPAKQSVSEPTVAKPIVKQESSQDRLRRELEERIQKAKGE